MGQPGKTICFTCGKAVGASPRFNTLKNGELCPTCRDRVLDTLPPLVPGFGLGREEEPQEAESLSEHGDERPDGPVGA
jgi:hypothetical protein